MTIKEQIEEKQKELVPLEEYARTAQRKAGDVVQEIGILQKKAAEEKLSPFKRWHKQYSKTDLTIVWGVCRKQGWNAFAECFVADLKARYPVDTLDIPLWLIAILEEMKED